MKPVAIDIAKATADQARAECERLGLELPQRMSTSGLRKKLKTHAQNYKIWQKYCQLATLLFGKSYTHGDTLDRVVADINNRLYERLFKHGYIISFNAHSSGKVQEIPNSKMLEDKGNGQKFFITGRQNAQVVHAQIFRREDQAAGAAGSYSIVFAARLAFADVDRAYRTWESGSAGY